MEAVNEGWTGRQLERQINSMLYERLLMSNDKESVLAVARKERIPEAPEEIIKDPMVLELPEQLISEINEVKKLTEGGSNFIGHDR